MNFERGDVVFHKTEDFGVGCVKDTNGEIKMNEQEIRIHVITEFAERLKKELPRTCWYDDEIDEIAEEVIKSFENNKEELER